MLLDHNVDLVPWNLVSKLLHCEVDIFFGDLVGTICVELIKDCHESLVSEELLQIERGREEL